MEALSVSQSLEKQLGILTRTALPVLGLDVSAEGQQGLDGVSVSFLQNGEFGISSALGAIPALHRHRFALSWSDLGVPGAPEDLGADGSQGQLPGAGKLGSMRQELLQLLLSHGNGPERCHEAAS